MKEPYERPSTYPPGFEPPTDVDVPWYAWVLWPFALFAALGVLSLIFYGLFSFLAPASGS